MKHAVELAEALVPAPVITSAHSATREPGKTQKTRRLSWAFARRHQETTVLSVIVANPELSVHQELPLMRLRCEGRWTIAPTQEPHRLT